MMERNTVLVPFSGGRDSSATALEMAHAKYSVQLFTFQAGSPELVGSNGDSAPDIRHKELLQAFPEHVQQKRIVVDNTYLIRKLAIEKTNKIHVVYPIALALAVHSHAILCCFKHGISHIAVGYSGYQAKEDRYIEQRSDFVELMRSFLNKYDISYHTPVLEKTKNDVIDVLESFGVSSNSLENKSIFGAIDFDIEKAESFWKESVPICESYIESMRKTKTYGT